MSTPDCVICCEPMKYGVDETDCCQQALHFQCHRDNFQCPFCRGQSIRAVKQFFAKVVLNECFPECKTRMQVGAHNKTLNVSGDMTDQSFLNYLAECCQTFRVSRVLCGNKVICDQFVSRIPAESTIHVFVSKSCSACLDRIAVDCSCDC